MLGALNDFLLLFRIIKTLSRAMSIDFLDIFDSALLKSIFHFSAQRPCELLKLSKMYLASG